MTTLGSRSILDKELAKLKDNVLRLSSMVDTNITQAMTALYQRDTLLAQQVVANDEEINRLRYELEQFCLLILATQAPTASDLRNVIATIHIAVELERIGDHAAGIARLVERMEDEDEISTFHKLPKMEKQTHKMLNESIDAYIQNDAGAARTLMARDDKIDKHYQKLVHEALEEMRDDVYIRRATFLLWVGHNLERIGDRAINIAERVIFMHTGEFVEMIEEFHAGDDLPS